MISPFAIAITLAILNYIVGKPLGNHDEDLLDLIERVLVEQALLDQLDLKDANITASPQHKTNGFTGKSQAEILQDMEEPCRDTASDCYELKHLCDYPKDDPVANRIKVQCKFTCGTCKSSWRACTDSTDAGLLQAYRSVYPNSISVPTCEGWALLCSVDGGPRTAYLIRAFCPMTCASCTRDECFANAEARDYRGTISTTISGKTCQKWTAQYPHQHVRTPGNFRGTGIGDHNFCRNPDLELAGAWCYTTDPDTRWELCDVGTPLTCH